MTLEKSPKKKLGRKPNNESQKRQAKLKEIIYNYSQEGKFLTQKKALAELKEAGFEISRSELARDKHVIVTNNNWIKNLAEENYSAYMEESFNMFKLGA